MLDHILTQDGLLIETETDVYGDQRLVSQESIKCRFREITEVDKQVNREGVSAADAIIWLNDSVDEGTIIRVENKYWRVARLVKARRLGDNDIKFYKAFVDKHQLASIS